MLVVAERQLYLEAYQAQVDADFQQFSLDLNRRNANQAISDDMLPELGMNTTTESLE